MEYSDELAYTLLSTLNLNAYKLPESPAKKSADFEITFQNERVIIEAKLKSSSTSELAGDNSKSLDNNITLTSSTVGVKAAIRKPSAKASQQLTASAEKGDFKILMFIVSDQETLNTEGKAHNIKQTMLGYTQFLRYDTIDQDKYPYATDCYFFYDSEFKRQKESIDALLLCKPGQSIGVDFNYELYLNPFSPSHETLRSSKFINSLPPNLIIDIEKLENNNLAYISDFCASSDQGRCNKDEIIKKLAEKYNATYLIEFNPPYDEYRLITHES